MSSYPQRCQRLGARSLQGTTVLHARPRRILHRAHVRLRPLHATGKHTQASEFQLPNGLILRHFTAEELNFLYREVHEDRVYLRHGVSLRPGDTVVDVGANTGLFTLLAAEEVGPEGRVVALEPLGHTFRLLRDNVVAHGEWCRLRGKEVCRPVLLNCGAGAEGQETATFTTYSDSASGWSTMYPDDAEVYGNMQRYIQHLLEGPAGGGGAADGGGSDVRQAAEHPLGGDGDAGRGDGNGGDAAANTAAASRASPSSSPLSSSGHRGTSGVEEPALARAGRALWRLPLLRPLLRVAASLYVRHMLGGQRRWTCRLVPLSRLIREQGLARIDLLKIDVERAELDVLAGLAPGDWALVRQVVLEVHDLDGRLEAVRRLLAEAGFARVVSEQDAALAGSTIHLVYGVRR